MIAADAELSLAKTMGSQALNLPAADTAAPPRIEHRRSRPSEAALIVQVPCLMIWRILRFQLTKAAT